MTAHPLVLPFLAQIVLTLGVLLWLAYTRISVLARKGGYAEVKRSGFPQRAVNASDNLKNQFEIPVLFLALCLFAIMSGLKPDLLIIAAWIFIAARVLHAVIHLGPNIIFPWRFGSFILSALALLTMTLITIVQVLS